MDGIDSGLCPTDNMEYFRPMRFIPIFKVSNMNAALRFYTGFLGFRVEQPADKPVLSLFLGKTELMLTSLEGDQLPATATMMLVEDIEEIFRTAKYSGLDLSSNPDSPVHQGIVEQTWGTLEFYVTDPDGNTIRFVQR